MCLVGVAPVATFGVGSAASAAPFSGLCSDIVNVILSKFFIENNLLLKLWRTFSITLNNDNPKSFKKGFLSKVFVLFPKLSNSIAKLLCLR